jgi:hypothetical protein
MSNFGIGLGAFVQGFGNGMEMRNRYEDRKIRNEQAKEDRAYTKDRRERQAELDARTDAEYQRNEAQRRTVEQIGLNAKADFDNRVKAGQENANDFDTYWSKNVVPKLTATYIANGDADSAKKMQAWADSADARKGGKLALEAMHLAQQGDFAGALKAAQQAGQVQGYINHGYEIGDQTEIVDNGGKLQGYRLNLKTQDGETITQDVPLKDIPTLLGQYLNPQAAWASQQAAAAADAKDKRELKNYTDKKGIDRQMGDGDKARSAAIASLRKRMDGGLTGDEKKFDDLQSEDQEAAIQKELDLQKGASGGAVGLGIDQATPQSTPADGSVGRKVLMDTATGQPVPLKPAAPAQATQPTQQSAAAPVSQEQRVQSVLQDSSNALSEGVQPELIKQQLLNNGVPEQIWPAALRAKLEQSQNQNGVFGLGR